MGNIPKFKYTEKNYPIDYPFGVYFKGKYIKEISKIISNHFSTDDIIKLIARGSSGVLIGSAILQEFYNNKYPQDIRLIIDRKPGEDCHSESFSGFGNNVGKVVIVDDFISTGDTIKCILDDLDNYLGQNLMKRKCKYDMLCVGNCLLPSSCKKGKCNLWRVYKHIYKRFNYIVCCPIQKLSK